MKISTVSGIVMAFVAGGLGAVAVPHLMPRAHAQAAAARQWEQLCVPMKDEASKAENVKHPYLHAVNLPTGWNKVLATMGAQGWELVSLIDSQATVIGAACFKRPKP